MSDFAMLYAYEVALVRKHAVSVLGWLGVFGVLATYAWAPAHFDLANAALCVPVALPAITRRAWPSAAISLAFGLIGFVHLTGGWR